MSDIEATAPEEPIVTTSAPDPAEAPAEVDEQNEPEQTDDSADGEEAPERDPLSKGVQRKINKLTRKVGDAERTAREFGLELELARERLKQYEQPEARQEPAPAQGDGKPTLSGFDFDQEAYAEALADWKFDQKIGQLRQQAESQKVAQTQQERQQAYQHREAEFAARTPDYEEIAFNPNVPITQSMFEVMMESPETAPEIAYYFGQNIDVAASIAQMSPIAQARAIGRIEAKFSPSTPSGQPPKKLSTAPPPVKTLNSSAPVSKALEDLSMEEYAARRNQERKARGLG